MLASTQTEANQATRALLERMQHLLGAAGVTHSIEFPLSKMYLGRLVGIQSTALSLTDTIVVLVDLAAVFVSLPGPMVW